MTQQTVKSISIDKEEIHSLTHLAPSGIKQLRAILDRAKRGDRIELEDAAALLNVENSQWLEEIYDTAREVKEKIFGKRIVLFAPLYISSSCTNNCVYCGFRRENSEADRKTLSIPEIVQQASFLSDRGYRRLLLVAGEDPAASSLEDLCSAVEAIYRQTRIRIVHLNVAPMTVEAFAELKASGAGVYQCFQETYHRETFERVHPSGPKHDYDWRVSVMDRAMEGGFDDVGMGALFGLYDHRFEVLSLISHARILEQRYGVGPHTVSVPRLRPAAGSPMNSVPYPVSDEEFKKIVAVFRLALPYAGVVVSTREGAELRDQSIHLGASQVSAGSRTDIGGYTQADNPAGTSQFSLSDPRSLDEMIRSIMEAGLLPSLCTSCYRSGRTGENFRHTAEQGGMKDFCHSNALFSLMEYLQHHAGEETRSRGLLKIREALSKLRNQSMRQGLEKRLEQIVEGEEDVHI